MLSKSLLGDIASGRQKALRQVPQDQQVRDRRAAAAPAEGQQLLTSSDESKLRDCFFRSGAGTWYEAIADRTFTSTFCDITPGEAKIIVEHWENQERIQHASPFSSTTNKELNWLLDQAILDESKQRLSALRVRLGSAVQEECDQSPASRAFVKLSTRSPKDSRQVLARAARAYRLRVAEHNNNDSAPRQLDCNDKWRLLSEELATASAVKNGTEALEILLDSYRVYQDLKYAQEGVEAKDGNQDAGGWSVSLVARAWNPQIKPETEFRGICWNGSLTCLCQYFHYLYFPEVVAAKDDIERDILDCFESPDVQAAVRLLGGNCIVDFARTGPGDTMIVELNPFDGEALGTFPVSTGLFLFDDPKDRQIMLGEAPFEFRVREIPIPEDQFKNPAWRAIINAGPLKYNG